jgi:NIMA (never in mitosis gene a)-related kinase
MEKYTKVRSIGEGAFGKALLVKDKGSGQQYVVKEIPMLRVIFKETYQK